MHGVHSTNSNLSPALITAVRRVLRPFIKLMLAKGITYPFLTEMLKDLYVEVAANDFKIGDKPSTDSHLSLLTGIHRNHATSGFTRGPAGQSLEQRSSLSGRKQST